MVIIWVTSHLFGFHVPFQHKYVYIRDERSGVESCTQ